LHVSKTRAPERPAFAHPAFDYENRIVTVDLPEVTVASVYVPNGGKDFEAKMRFLTALEEFTREMHERSRPIVVCGDLNIARTDMDVHPKERKPRIIGQLPEERALLERIIGNGLVDTGRALDPENDQMFTWWAPWRNMRQRNIGWRLDYLLATRSVFDAVGRCVVQREFGTSDHAPVFAEYAIGAAVAPPKVRVSTPALAPPPDPQGSLFQRETRFNAATCCRPAVTRTQARFMTSWVRQRRVGN
jgi:exodeoxyribonuclease-3